MRHPHTAQRSVSPTLIHTHTATRAHASASDPLLTLDIMTASDTEVEAQYVGGG